MGAAFSKHSSWHPGRNFFLVVGAIHVLLFGCAYNMAINSQRNGTRLSPGGLATGFGLAYFASTIYCLVKYIDVKVVSDFQPKNG